MVHNTFAGFVKKSIKKLKGTYVSAFKNTRVTEEITYSESPSEPSYQSVTAIEEFGDSNQPLLNNSSSTDSGINDPSREKRNKKNKKLQFSTEVVCHTSDGEFRTLESDDQHNSDECHSSDECPLNTSFSSIEATRPSTSSTPEGPVYSPVIKVKVKTSQTPVASKPNIIQLQEGSNSSIGTEYFRSPDTQNTNLENTEESLYSVPTPSKSRSSNSKNNYLEDSEESLYTVPTPVKYRCQNVKTSKDVFTKEDLEPLSLIHQTNWILPEGLENFKCDLEEGKSSEDKSLSEKFVVNLFESRPSKRWAKNPVIIDHSKIAKNTEDVEEHFLENQIKQLEETFKNLEIQNQTFQQNSEILEEEGQYGNTLIKYMNSNEYKTFKELRRDRDIECVRMSQVTKALLEMKKNPHTGWCEELVAERLLLGADEKVTLLTNKIRDTYTELKCAAYHTGTIQLSDISFPLKPATTKVKDSKHFTDFYVMTVSYDCHLLISNFIMAGENSIDFNHTFTFGNIDSDFELKVRLFCIKLRTSKDMKEKFMEKLGYHLCATSKIIYEDINTRQVQERVVLKPSFKLVAEAILTRDHLEGTKAILTVPTSTNNKFKVEAHFNLNVKEVNLEKSNYAGFLTVGKKINGSIFWERKWCVLTAPMLMIYNYPNDLDFDNPCDQINLKYCFGPILSKATSCPRNNAFNLKTGVPLSFNQSATVNRTLKSKPNFNLEKYYFKADTFGEYVKWTQEVNNILGSLKDWKNLAFSEENYEYARV